MTAEPQFWLPSLFRIDDQVHGRMFGPVIADDLNVRRVLGLVGIDVKFIEDFLDDVGHAFEALFLAGYKVPWFEIGLQGLTDIRMDEVSTSQIWLRVDLQHRRLEVNYRDDTDQSNRIRMKILPIQTVDRRFALNMAEPRVVEVLAGTGAVSPAAQAVLDATMRDYLEEKLSHGTSLPADFLVIHGDPAFTVAEYRAYMARLLAGGTDDHDVAVMPLGFRVDHTVYANARDATAAVFEAFSHAIFDTITWFTGNLILKEVGEHLNAAEAAGVNGLDFARDLNLPGMVWVLNPDTWGALWPESRSIQNIPKTLDELQSVARMMYEFVGSTELLRFGDLTNLSSPPANPQLSDFAPEKRAGFLYGLIFGRGLDIAAEPAIAFGYWDRWPLEQLIDLILGHSARRNRYERNRADRWGTGKPVVVDNPFEKVTDSLEGLLNARLLTVVSENEAPYFAGEIDNYLKTFYDAYKTLILDYGDDRGLTSTKLPMRMARKESYLTVVLSLFNLGIFSIEMHTGDLNEDVPTGAVEVLVDEETIPTFGTHLRWRFKHVLYDLPGFLVWQQGNIAEPGLTMRDLVAWEYVPAQPAPPEPVLSTLVAAGVFPADNRDKLVLVLGPGIAVTGLENWPSQVPLEIHRVQSPALVPNREERIDVKSITSPFVIGILDDITHIDGSNHAIIPDPMRPDEASIEDEADRRHEFQDLAPDHPDRLPFVTVTPVRKNGKCGVTLATKYPGNAYYRGIDGASAVEILVDETSGSDRFAFDIRYTIHKLKRAVGSHQETRVSFHPGSNTEFEHDVTITDHDIVDVAQFEIIVKATPGVQININDNKIGPIYDLFVDVFGGVLRDWADPIDDTALYEFWRSNSLSAIPVQGTPLVPGGSGFSQDNGPYSLRNNEAIVEHLEFMVDMTVGMVPVIGEATDVIELAASLYTGTDKWGRPMSNFDRMLIIGGLALPLVSGKTLKVVKGQLPPGTLLKSVAGLD